MGPAALLTIIWIAYLANAGGAPGWRQCRTESYIGNRHCPGRLAGNSRRMEVFVNTAERLINRSVVPGGEVSPKPILLIEGDFQYSVAVSRVFRELQLLDGLVISVDCENALARLRQAKSCRPHLILLDLEMPRMSAFGFLKAVKSDERLQMIPVVTLAATDDVERVSRCYGLGAAGYMVKPRSYAELLDKMTAVCGYWSLSRVPSVE